MAETKSPRKRGKTPLILLSPAKSLDFETPAPTRKAGIPRFLDDQTGELAGLLKEKTAVELAGLMSLSARLAELNFRRYQSFDPAVVRRQAKKAGQTGGRGREATPPAAKQALWAFTGDVYQGFDAPSLKGRNIDRADQRIRILSGLYGYLRPLDLMLPYRLEMGTRLETPRGRDLYQFWGSAITEGLAEEGPPWICNLASKEYYRSVREKELPCPVVHPVFQDESGGTFKVLGMFAKHARGLMARWLVDNDVRDPGELPEFDSGGYRFNAPDSTPSAPVFRRPATAR